MPNPFATNAHYSPDTLEAAIRHLRDSAAIQIQLAHHALGADKAALFADDLVLIGIVQRSLDLIDAFALLTECGNAAAAIPLLRLQLDSCMRFFACSLLLDKSELLTKLLSGEPITKIKTPDGQRLTDAFLHKKLSEIFPWFSHVYQFACRFVHLSTPGMLSGVTSVGSDEDRTVRFHIGRGVGREWREHDRKEAVDAFIGATEILCSLIGSWEFAKKEGATRRARNGC